MDFLPILLLAIILGLLVFSLFSPQKNAQERDILLRENAEIKAKNEILISEKSEITERLRALEKEKNETAEREKMLSVDNRDLKTELQHFREHTAELKKTLTQYESEKSAREKEFLEKIEKLEHAREKFHAEQERVRREDETVQQKALADRDRMWAEHENSVISELKTICQKPEIDFRFFDNETLPDHFHGHFKPDFLVDFLGRFLYFDAKVSRSDNLEVYLKNQFRSTAEKLKKFGGEIFKSVFFVVPTDAISVLKKRSETLDGFSFFVISPEAMEPILATYKTVARLQNAEKLVASDSEAVVDVLAHFEHFIKNQNAANILLAQKAFETLQKKDALSSDFLEEFSRALRNLKPLKFKDADFKRLSENLLEQKSSVQKITAPETKVSEAELKTAGTLFESPKS